MRQPSPTSSPAASRRARQRGVAAVEFAVVSLLFFTVLLGIMEFGRWLFTLNAAAEATRWGARLAAVCDKDDPDIKARMRAILPGISDAQIILTYTPQNCSPTGTANNCTSVTVSITDATFTPLIPFMGVAVPLPPFATSLPREAMNSNNNAVCS